MESTIGIGRLLTACISVSFAAGCAHQNKPAAAQVEENAWAEGGPDGRELLTDHFAIRLTARDAVLREVLPAFLETAFAEYTRLIRTPRTDTERLPVYLFETREEWARFTRRFAPTQADTYLHIQSGGFTDFRTGTAVAFDIARDRTLSLLAHEGFHQYAARYLPEPLPPWLNEALACQFESFTLDGNRPTFTPARNLLRMGNLREALTIENGLIPFEELLRMHAGQAVRQTGQPVRAYYAQLWSTVAYLRDAKCPYASGFQRLLADAGTARLGVSIRGFRAVTPGSDMMSDAQIAFRHYVTADLDAFMKDYRAFAQRLVR